MSSSITLQLDMRDFPEAPILGVLTRMGGRTHHAAQVRLHEPISCAGLAKVAQVVVRAWLEPELAAHGDDQLSDYLDSLGERLL